nr:uncharacterized protein LOC112004288 [Quercus suber]
MVWEQQAEWDFRGSGAFGTFKELVEHVVVEGKDLALFATIVWTVWHRRNAMRTSSNPFPVQQIQQLVRSLRADFVRFLLPKPPDQPPPTSLRPIGKLPPPWPDIKVNFDRACFQDEKLSGAAAVIRDVNGQVLAIMADRFPLPHSIVAVEVTVAIKALKLALELGHTSIILEGDSKIAIEAMQTGLPPLADYGHLIEEAKMLAESFVAVVYSFVPRQ